MTYVNMEVGFLRDIPAANMRYVINQLDRHNDCERIAHALKETCDLSTVEIDNLNFVGYNACAYFFKVLQCKQPKLKTKTFIEHLYEIDRHDLIDFMKRNTWPKFFFDIPFCKQQEIALYLNILTINWKTLAAKFGYTDEDIATMDLNKPRKQLSPTEYLLTIICHRQPHLKTEEFKRALVGIKRHDLIYYLDNLSSSV